MLTNGKKVWGIWNGAAFVAKNNKLVVFDDYNVALAELSSVAEYACCEIRIVSEGHGSNVPGVYPSNMETKTDNHESQTAG